MGKGQEAHAPSPSIPAVREVQGTWVHSGTQNRFGDSCGLFRTIPGPAGNSGEERPTWRGGSTGEGKAGVWAWHSRRRPRRREGTDWEVLGGTVWISDNGLGAGVR